MTTQEKSEVPGTEIPEAQPEIERNFNFTIKGTDPGANQLHNTCAKEVVETLEHVGMRQLCCAMMQVSLRGDNTTLSEEDRNAYYAFWETLNFIG